MAWEIEKRLREGGAEGLAFEPIVAAGPNSAKPMISSLPDAQGMSVSSAGANLDVEPQRRKSVGYAAKGQGQLVLLPIANLRW
ncbi:MAG: hypothetical protein P8141_12040 [Gammaproteobacteria bacterium]